MENNVNNIQNEEKKYKKKRKRRGSKNRPAEITYIPKGDPKVLNTPIEELGLSEATFNALKNGKINLIFDIAQRKMAEMYKIQNIGKKNCIEIRNKLKKYNIDFRPDAEDEASQKLNKVDNKKPKNNKQKNNRADNKIQANEPEEKPEFLKFSRRGKYGLLDSNNNEIVPAMYDDIFFFKDDLACVEIDGKYGFINKENQLVIEAKYDIALSFNNGISSVTIGDYSGLINLKGEEVLPIEYDIVTSSHDNTIVVKKDDRWGVIENDDMQIRWI